MRRGDMIIYIVGFLLVAEISCRGGSGIHRTGNQMSPCEDIYPDRCREHSRRGEIQCANPSASVRKHCKKTCNLCSDMGAANNGAESQCKDVYPDWCLKRSKSRICSPDSGFKYHCMKTCNLCSAANPEPVKSAQKSQGSNPSPLKAAPRTPCVDDKPECTAFAAAQLCFGEKRIMHKYCKKSCHVC